MSIVEIGNTYPLLCYAASLHFSAILLSSQISDIVRKLVSPFVDLIALLVALAFGLGILGFIFLLIQGALKWTVGGGFGRSMAVQTFIRAAEVLAIIPLLFFIASILKGLGFKELAVVADILLKLLNRGWELIVSSL